MGCKSYFRAIPKAKMLVVWHIAKLLEDGGRFEVVGAIIEAEVVFFL